MILNTGGRTDTVQYYTKWLLKRLEEGYVLSRNPLFPNKVTRYELTPEAVDCMVFCSKDFTPILHVEPGVPSIDQSMGTLIRLSEIVGKGRIAWRYDPVLLTETYTVQTHLNTFGRMAAKLAPHVDRCIFSFVEMYKKLATNMPELIPLTASDQDKLASGLGGIAKQHGLLIQTCGSNGDYTHYGIETSGCMTLDILGEANGIQFRNLKHKGMRAGCHCIESRDIGAYDTCLNGCKYCYANKSPQKARDNYKLHDPDSPLLLGYVQPTDLIQQGNQKSYLQILPRR